MRRQGPPTAREVRDVAGDGLEFVGYFRERQERALASASSLSNCSSALIASP
jgi:hypothetical protein